MDCICSWGYLPGYCGVRRVLFAGLRDGDVTTPTREEELVVELNSNILKTIQSLPSNLHSFKDDNLNERKEQQATNKDLLQNMMGGSLDGHPIHSTNKFKIDFYHKLDNSPK